MTRLETILVGAYADLLAWKATDSVQVSGVGPSRMRLAAHNVRVGYAADDVVRCDAARWLGRPPLPGDAACNTRTYRELKKRGLACPISGSPCRRGRTVALYLTEAGKLRAAELLKSQITESTTLVDSAPAAAISGTCLEVS
jgi:hypothetical protein